MTPRDSVQIFNRDNKMGSKIFNDIVHGNIELHPLIVSIIDTPQFQRLRNIKQDGPCYFVYPGAVHTRFEHSLGTCFLAGRLMEALNRKRGIFDEERRKETLCVEIAGLCHDLGHGPFSHTWEKFMKRCNLPHWKHERMSVEIFDRILGESVPDKDDTCFNKEILVIDLFRRFGMEDYIDKIKNIILGNGSQDTKKLYMFQIISNEKNGIDVDKWDYLMRDSKMVNVPISFDCRRMLHSCEILETSPNKLEICFRDKECTGLINMFLSRGMLHDIVYQHRKVKVIEEMLIDAFILAKDRLNLTSENIEDFMKLTDHIYQKILYEDFQDDKNMLKAKKVLENLTKRKLYVCIAAAEVEKGVLKEGLVKKLEENIYLKLKENDNALERKLIKALKIKVDMTKYNKNQLLNGVQVYPKKNMKGDNSRPEPFDIRKFHNLKPELKNMKRTEVLILYKGEDFSIYRSNCFNRFLPSMLKDLDPELL